MIETATTAKKEDSLEPLNSTNHGLNGINES